MTKTSGVSSHGGGHDLDESKVDNKSANDKSKDAARDSSNASRGSAAASGAGAVIDKVGGAATFEALIAELKAVNQEAMVQDMRLRSLSTELSSERKAASERVNG